MGAEATAVPYKRWHSLVVGLLLLLVVVAVLGLVLGLKSSDEPLAASSHPDGSFLA